MREVKTAFDRGRDELAQALKAFPESIGQSYSTAYEQATEKAMDKMEGKDILKGDKNDPYRISPENQKIIRDAYKEVGIDIPEPEKENPQEKEKER